MQLYLELFIDRQVTSDLRIMFSSTYYIIEFKEENREETCHTLFIAYRRADREGQKSQVRKTWIDDERAREGEKHGEKNKRS